VKLNFEALTGPVTAALTPKARGQTGTAGTPASMLARAPAGIGDSAGTPGDGGAEAIGHAALLTASCPQASPLRPSLTARERANEINESPASPLVPAIATKKAGNKHAKDEAFEERAAIMEFDGRLTRADVVSVTN
jgi:hypothetical protein